MLSNNLQASSSQSGLKGKNRIKEVEAQANIRNYTTPMVMQLHLHNGHQCRQDLVAKNIGDKI